MVFSHKIQLSKEEIDLLKSENVNLDFKVGENIFQDLHIFEILNIFKQKSIKKRTERIPIYTIRLTQEDLKNLGETKLKVGLNKIRKIDLEKMEELGLKYDTI